jgi:hypothetical protein
VLVASAGAHSALLAYPWGHTLSPGARAAQQVLAEGIRFALVTNGSALRIADCARRSARDGIEFDLAGCALDEASLGVLCALAGSLGLAYAAHEQESRLERAIRESDAGGIRVCHALRHGVRDAVHTFDRALRTAPRRKATSVVGGDEALTSVYRILFLLFAEARALVPSWHPVYRDAYTVDALRQRLERGDSPRGTWAALQAIARLAHAGCDSDDLHVAPFNGRLFAPTQSPLLDHVTLDDDEVAKALASLAFVADREVGRRRVTYEDLGVEQLGSIYEHLLDDRPAPPDVARSSSLRKATGSFYTPAPLTEYLVRATLEPLVHGRPAAEILRLRVLDPAMGSGAFLVAACRFLATACERALINTGEATADEFDAERRAHLRREVAQRCLFGLDTNPMAVQLAQLSLWLATLASGRPLSFLDHHLLCGDSLLGASPLDVVRQPPSGPRSARSGNLPLEALFEWSDSLAPLLPMRQALEDRADDNVAVVRDKEAALAALRRHPAFNRWRDACDVWCVPWVSDARETRALYPALLDRALGRISTLPPVQADRRLAEALAEARRWRCFHWTLELPEVFLDTDGHPRPEGGFDAILGNPPWEMLRADHGSAAARALVRFSRGSGIYRAQSRGHANQYQLFLERALGLLRPGGRLGLIVPGGLLTDHGAALLRRELLFRHGFESALVFDNRRSIFPIHRGVRFVALTARAQTHTPHVACRFGITDVDDLDTVNPATPTGFPVMLTHAVLERLSGAQLAIPDLPDARDLRLLESLATRHKALGETDGWNVHFGRELNASDDRDCLVDGDRRGGLAVVEGKHIEPYRVQLGRVTRRASRDRVLVRLGPRAAVDRPRLGYREVAASTNRLTLIAAILPPHTVSVHTVFCLREPLPLEAQDVLAALLNSFVANYLVRRWVTTHVTRDVIERLPMPTIALAGAHWRALASLAATMRLGSESDDGAAAQVQATAAHAYGISVEDFDYILTTFPLVDQRSRSAALEALRSIAD